MEEKQLWLWQSPFCVLCPLFNLHSGHLECLTYTHFVGKEAEVQEVK